MQSTLPEGLKTMLEDDNIEVKLLESAEKIPKVTDICTEKIGTLTSGKLSVVQIMAGRVIDLPPPDQPLGDILASGDFRSRIEQNVAMIKEDEFCGQSDKALIDLVKRWGGNLDDIRAKHYTEGHVKFPFTSKRKQASAILENVEDACVGYQKRLMVKGASEIILSSCNSYLNENNEVQIIGDAKRDELHQQIQSMGQKSMRTLALAYKNVEPGENGVNHDEPQDADKKDIESSKLTLICIVGLMETINPGVPESIQACNDTGITVRMVTGENLMTATAIAIQAKIITEEQSTQELVCLNGQDFCEMIGGIAKDENGNDIVSNLEKFKEIASKCRVVGRCRPDDKYLMVCGLRQMGSVVMATAYGTSEAPAAKLADVGVAMGDCTDVAMAASDFWIKDGNFNHLVQLLIDARTQ